MSHATRKKTIGWSDGRTLPPSFPSQSQSVVECVTKENGTSHKSGALSSAIRASRSPLD